MTPSLEAHVVLTRGDLHLDVHLSAEAGEVVGLVGPNGAGKTTLLRALAGLQPLDEGRVILDGQVLDDPGAGRHVPAEDRRVGVVFQDYLLFASLSALENVAFGLRSRGTPKAEARRLAAEWLGRVGLDGAAAGARPARLSGGQAQRVALARALATEPRLLLLDEPLAALDASARPETRRDLRRHLDGHDGVHLVVTHDPLEAMALADRLVVLEEGRVTQAGTAAEVAGRPRSAYVADLVGVNLLRGRAAGDRVELPGGAALIVPEAGAGDVLAVVHPRAVALHRRAPEGTPRNVWQGVVESLDMEGPGGPPSGPLSGGQGPSGPLSGGQGSRARARIGGPIPLVAEVTPAAVADLALAAGAEVWVSVKASEVTVYPA